MRLLLPSSPLACVPFRIVDGVGEPGGRLGGHPPKGVVPTECAVATRYFATVPLATGPMRCASIFVADLEPLMGVRGRVNEAGLLQVALHSEMPREPAASSLDSPLSEHGFRFLEPTDDWVEDDDGQMVIRAGHKIGGREYLVRESAGLLGDLAAIRDEGYVLAAQFDFPSAQDAVISGDWPFADGVFALFGKAPFGRLDWRWYWDF